MFALRIAHPNALYMPTKRFSKVIRRLIRLTHNATPAADLKTTKRIKRAARRVTQLTNLGVLRNSDPEYRRGARTLAKASLWSALFALFVAFAVAFVIPAYQLGDQVDAIQSGALKQSSVLPQDMQHTLQVTAVLFIIIFSTASLIMNIYGIRSLSTLSKEARASTNVIRTCATFISLLAFSAAVVIAFQA
jgi:hypothetical protein